MIPTGKKDTEHEQLLWSAYFRATCTVPQREINVHMISYIREEKEDLSGGDPGLWQRAVYAFRQLVGRLNRCQSMFL